MDASDYFAQFPKDDYALSILSQAATHQNQSSSYATSRNVTEENYRGSKPNKHSNQVQQEFEHNIQSRGAQSRVGPLLGDGHEMGRRIETLAFNPSSAALERQSYLDGIGGYQNLGAQIYGNTNGLSILNAESYDDGRARADARNFGLRQHNQKQTMPFGIVEGTRKADGDEGSEGSGKRKKKHRNESGDEEDEARKKARGRPRVDTKDETAADRRRTQIRMAQRAYRNRKEITISSLEKQVQDLKGTNEEMSNIFINLYDFAVAKGLLQREPEFGQHLQSTTERFLALAKAIQADEHEETNDDATIAAKVQEVDHTPRAKGRRKSPKKSPQVTPPVSEPLSPAWGGYSISKEDSPVRDISLEHRINGNGQRNELEIITRPTEENASFPFSLLDLQAYPVEVPEVSDLSQNFFLQSQLPLPRTHNDQELSFARRLFRYSSERAFTLITSTDPNRIERLHQVFGFCLLYESKEAIIQRLKRVLDSSVKDPLPDWRQPFLHLGGAGTYYPLDDGDLSDTMPKLRTGYSMGPFSPAANEARDLLQDGMKCNLPGFEGEFFDPNDVEGYLRGRGLFIAPTAEFVTAELDLMTLAGATTPKSSDNDSVTSLISPQTPASPGNLVTWDTGSHFSLPKSNSAVSKSMTLPFPFASSFLSWETGAKDDDSNLIDPALSDILDQDTITSDRRPQNGKRMVTINVITLMDELISRGVCLGRSPGFRPADINTAIIAAIQEDF
ncbi:hypothetical protein B0O99DRAFT_30332 [Bisporella sp. PMI_857]|nr:hypothetical protein B0O99DRAFT_30332 [Bisporella sp. PMI_857]